LLEFSLRTTKPDFGSPVFLLKSFPTAIFFPPIETNVDINASSLIDRLEEIDQYSDLINLVLSFSLSTIIFRE